MTLKLNRGCLDGVDTLNNLVYGKKVTPLYKKRVTSGYQNATKKSKSLRSGIIQFLGKWEGEFLLLAWVLMTIGIFLIVRG